MAFGELPFAGVCTVPYVPEEEKVFGRIALCVRKVAMFCFIKEGCCGVMLSVQARKGVKLCCM